MNKNLDIQESSIESIDIGLDSILGSLEESGKLKQQLMAHMGEEKTEVLCRIIQYGTLNKAGYDMLRKEKTGYFRTLFAKLDMNSVEQDLGIKMGEEEKKGFAGVFEMQIIQTLVNYEIFGYILSKEFGEKYNLIFTFSGGNIYQDTQSGVFFLRVGENFYPEANIVDEHYDNQDSYLYFDGGDIFFIYDIKVSNIRELEGEFDSVTEVLGKHYILFHSPNEESATKTYFHCIEDNSENKKNIHGNAGYFLKVFDFHNDIFTVVSDHYEYKGYVGKNTGIKFGNTSKIEKYGEKGCFIEQEGVFRDVRIFGDAICLITEKRDFYEDEKGKIINSRTYVIEYYDKEGSSLEKQLSIPLHKIQFKEETNNDIVLGVEREKENLDIFSLGKSMAASFFSQVPISKIDHIEDDRPRGIIVHFTYSTGKKGFFLSADYLSHQRH